jgi:putative ABC transport system permease protein
MFNNLIKHSIRSFKRQRSYIIINILGLSIGIACSLLIALFVINEASYDRFNLKKDRLFRVVLDGKIGGQEIKGAWTSAPMGPVLVKEVPEVEDFLRMDGTGPTAVEYNQQSFVDNHIIIADSSFFNFFSIPVLKGDPVNMLNAAHKVVLSEKMAAKIFGKENPIDKYIKIGTDSTRFVVTGVMGDVPENCHFAASMVISYVTYAKWRDPIWLSNNLSTYVLLKPNSSAKNVDTKFKDLIVKYVGPEIQKFIQSSLEDFIKKGNRYRLYLQPVTDIHLDPSLEQVFKPASDPKYLIIFGTIAILVIVIAAINFMNLSTAQASRRAKEVGIKKLGGSTRGMLITQFLTESLILSFVSMIFALLIVRLSLPYFNNLLNSTLTLSLFAKWYTIPALVLFATAVGIISGSYPAFFLSSFNPYEVLKGSMRNSMKNGHLRRVLVVVQFAVSILLIVGTMIMYRQIKYMLHKDVGFKKEQMLVIERADAISSKLKTFKTAVKNIPGVLNVSSSTAVPGRNNNNNGYLIEGRKDETFLMQTNWVDYDFLATYGIELSGGRFFEESHSSDKNACLVNESAVKNFNLTSVEKTRVMEPSPDSVHYMPIIGVVRNFNFESLRNPIQPYIFKFQGENRIWGYISVRLQAGSYSRTISEIEKVWKEYAANIPLQYYFLDADFEQMYRQETQNAKLAVIFAILAIFIAALGLFGLTSYTVEQRTREIGVRKAMGSSISGIYVEISREIVILVTVSGLIASPVIYYYAGKWLQNFYYKIDIGIITLVAGLAVALGIALITISYRVIAAARVNPAQSLKYE